MIKLLRLLRACFRKEIRDAEMTEQMRVQSERWKETKIVAGIPPVDARSVALASWLPAHRAARINPLVALQCE